MTGDTFVVYGGMRFALANMDFGPRGDFSLSQIGVVVPTGFLCVIREGGSYSRRMRGRLRSATAWLRKQERSRRTRLIASHTASFRVGGLLPTIVWWAATR